jgi:S-adenosylmethionine hydrolase
VIAGQKLLGTIVYIDHYGNAITNIPGKTAGVFGMKPGGWVRITMPQGEFNSKLGTIYSDVPQGEEIVFVVNNLGTVQMSINLGNFASTHGVKAGTKFEIELLPPLQSVL